MNRVLCWLPAVLSMLACSSPDQRESELEGSVELSLKTSSVTINSITYTLSGANYSETSVLNVARSTRISARFGGLLPGAYSITFSATDANDPSIRCTGAAGFDIVAGQANQVGINLYCWRDAMAGSVEIIGSVYRCPTVDSFSAVPSEVLVGEVIHLSAVVDDPESNLVYEWSASNGTLTGANTLNAELTCTSAGTVDLQLLAVNLEANCAQTASGVAYCTADSTEVPDEPSPP
ncbi:MAG: hypothetical protein EOO73_27645 [Myxococcales bacterium]|nr:MAG: hypothetical protein EOO73_27645 [Myxococcales bacterium]